MKSTVIVLFLVILCSLAIAVPGSASKATSQQGLLVQSHSSATGTGAFLTTYTAQKPVITQWQTATIYPAFHQTLVSKDQLISQYATLTSGGNGMFYPGGMAAAMGGGGCCGG